MVGPGVGTDYHETAVVDEAVLVQSSLREGEGAERFHFLVGIARWGGGGEGSGWGELEINLYRRIFSRIVLLILL
jgi:hypothetical protein